MVKKKLVEEVHGFLQSKTWFYLSALFLLRDGSFLDDEQMLEKNKEEFFDENDEGDEEQQNILETKLQCLKENIKNTFEVIYFTYNLAHNFIDE